jgi:hypothetical protein
MPSEFEDPELAPIRAQEIGPQQILRWALLTAVAGAVMSWLRTVLLAFGASGPSDSLSQLGSGGGIFGLIFFSGLTLPFVTVGTGLAIAATVEVRRATEEAGSGTELAVWVTWALLALGALGVFLPAGNP